MNRATEYKRSLCEGGSQRLRKTIVNTLRRETYHTRAYRVGISHFNREAESLDP